MPRVSRFLDPDAALAWSAAICVSIAGVLWLGPWLARVDLFSQDATQHVYWLYRYADPQLFPGDLSIGYFSATSSAPWGYRALYSVIVPWLDALKAAEWLSAPLLAWSALLAWRLGQAVDSADRPLMGLLAVVVMLVLLPRVDLLPPMAFQRSFALPLTLLSVWALVSRRYAWVGVSWVAAALVYPIVVPVLGLTAGVVFLLDLVRERRMPPWWVWNGLLGAAAIVIILMQGGDAPGIGPMVTFQQAQAMPEFGPGGRQVLFGTGFSANWFGHHRTGLGWSPWLVLALIASVAIAAGFGRLRTIPIAVWSIGFVGVVLWFIARLVMFNLYLPNRHSRWSLAAFALVVLAVATYSLLAGAGRRTIDAKMPVRPGTKRAVAIGAPLVVAVALLPAAAAAWRLPVDHDLERAYDYLSVLPKDTLVAAHPDIADDIPLRTRRPVLASSEASVAFMSGYYARLKPRLEASLRATYASSWADFDRNLRPYGVDVVLTGPPVWVAGDYYRPFDQLVRPLREAGKANGFVLQAPPAERVLFQSGGWYVVQVFPAGGPHE